MIGPLCPKSISREPHGLTKVPNGPQMYTVNILLLQKEGAQIHVSERGQSLTFTKDMGQGFPPSLHTSYTMDYLLALVCDGVFSGCYVPSVDLSQPWTEFY